MKKFVNYMSAMLVVAFGFFAVSCDDTDEVEITDPNESEFDVTLKVVDDSTTANPDVSYTVTSETGSAIVARIHFVNNVGVNMQRLYITANAMNSGEVVFKPTELSNSSFKGDGSVGLEASASDEFDFKFELPVPDSITEGTLVYKFWATNGKGDFRNDAKNTAAGPGTITVKFGGTNPSADEQQVKSFEDVKLSAPLADGTSKTFVSLVDGTTFNVNSGAEFATQWDIGYLYSTATADAATLRPAYNYPTVAIDIPAKSGVANDELNKTYFKKSTEFTAEEFDAISISGELNAVAVEQTEANLKVVQLAAGDVVEFVDNYGNKGLLKVLEVSGTNGSNGFIRIAIKVQP